MKLGDWFGPVAARSGGSRDPVCSTTTIRKPYVRYVVYVRLYAIKTSLHYQQYTAFIMPLASSLYRVVDR